MNHRRGLVLPASSVIGDALSELRAPAQTLTLPGFGQAPEAKEERESARRLLNTADRILAARNARNGDNAQVLGFTPRDFVIFGLPYKDPKTSRYVRRNGAVTFTITGGELGVPFAQDRLIVIWLSTAFKICGSPASNAISFQSARAVCGSLGKSTAKYQINRLETGFLRIFDSTFLASDSRTNAAQRDRYQLMRRLRLSREMVAGQPNQHSKMPNVIVYDPVFANDIRNDAVPTDFQSVLALNENMGPLSLYQFEAYTSYVLARSNKPDRRIPVGGSNGLLAQIGGGLRENNNGSVSKKAVATMRKWHAVVKTLWPGCPNELVDNGETMIVRAGYAIQHGRLPKPAEFGVRPLGMDELEAALVRTPSVIDREQREARELAAPGADGEE